MLGGSIALRFPLTKLQKKNRRPLVVSCVCYRRSGSEIGGERGEGARMAAVQCTRCTAEKRGFRRELDSWRHRLIHCVGMGFKNRL